MSDPDVSTFEMNTDMITDGSTTTPVVNSSVQVWIIPVTVVVVVLVIAAAVIAIVLAILRCRQTKGEYSPPSESPDFDHPIPQKPVYVYEELPDSIFKPGGALLNRQNGIEYDQSNPKADNFSHHGSEDHYSKSGGGGSDLSGLSGVSGNAPGAHRMPTYSHDPSVVSEPYLVPPWDRRCPECATNTGHARSAIVTSASNPDHANNPRSATEVGHTGHAQMPGRHSFSHGHINHDGVDMRDFFLKEQNRDPSFPQFSAPYVPHPSSVISGSWHSGLQSSISDVNLLTVLNCLMHNKECEIQGCPCRQLQGRYQHLLAGLVPLQQMKSPERKKSPEHKRRRPSELLVSSSTESDSDVPVPSSSRRTKMRLKLTDERKLHPHYHMSTHSHHVGKAASNVDSHRRSRSLSDLTPITELRETPTPMVGGAIKAGTPIHCGRILGVGENATLLGPTKEELLQHTALTPRSISSPPLLMDVSLSENNIPVLCLNNCPLPPSPMKKGKARLDDLSRHNSNKLPLKPLQEVGNVTETDDSNTSSRSDSPEATKSSHSDDNDEVVPHQNRINQSSSYAVRRGGSTSGYESETCNGVASSLDPVVYVRGHMSPSSRRSSSPFETETTVSSDGAVIKTTEC
jgi:hypothetical protein